MSKDTRRWSAAALGFAAAVIWTTVGAQAAVTCLLAAGLCAGVVIVREGGLVGKLTGAQATQPRPKPTPEPAPVVRPYDHDESSGEHVYEVANYGW